MLLTQSGNQTDIFWKFYSPADTLWLPKTIWQVLGYATGKGEQPMHYTKNKLVSHFHITFLASQF